MNIPDKDRPVRAAFVIAAGGSGTRMNAGVPKQFLELGGKPILLRTVEAVAALEAVAQVVIALPPEHIAQAEEILSQQPLRIPVECVVGGPNRQASVRNGCMRVHPGTDIILVHDAVRPFCPREVMERVLAAALEKGAAVPGLPATETIQRVSRTGRVRKTPPREELYAIQTPQAFHARLLVDALDRAAAEGFIGTDESSVVRWFGHPVAVVAGDPENIKITRPMDMPLARLLLQMRSQQWNEQEHSQRNGADMADGSGQAGCDLRVGHGIDYHRLVQGRKLILGGVEIPFEKGLEGHSDADALLHAVCDALLGAAALGDIGRHFPDTDPAYRGRDSRFFLGEVRAKIAVAGWQVKNVDATLLLQRPKIAPHAEAMRRNIAETLGIDLQNVNVKATTTEGMNAEGRGEGVSAQAVALLYRKLN
ncbi:MAG: 2-C-methyl-D-erythritol 4-phosphate cytidylyltransferase [Acidobacteriota bacterium]|jgi:2-C-methyl-D-erythritol 4-phosphate cytidylyltransferase/2-C-methyl-D-erythritol 2,4-cyclodiphosphate synthase|nr:2-C-methyl-D-erythritol 4-phosphate cytidylyltransferase [Acidobacteriota bacterium]